MADRAAQLAARKARGAASRAAGRRQELIAALLLMAKGYRVLGFRLKTPQGEVDLLAQRGQVLAVVEVKSRTSLQAALEAVSAAQVLRLRRAGEALAARRPDRLRLNVRLDLVALAPRRWPRHIPDAWRDDGAALRVRGGT
jgi:putative endonuclease